MSATLLVFVPAHQDISEHALGRAHTSNITIFPIHPIALPTPFPLLCDGIRSGVKAAAGRAARAAAVAGQCRRGYLHRCQLWVAPWRLGGFGT